MVRTIHHSKAGTVEYVPIARLCIPLEDPEAYGNLGMQGYDEDYRSGGEFTELWGAEAWMRWALANIEHAQSVEIDRVEWTEDVFSDDEYGTARQLEGIAGSVGGPVHTELLPGCGHTPHRDRPDAVLARLETFLRPLLF